MPLHVLQSWLLKNWLHARMIIRKANIFLLSAAGGINRMCNDDKLLNRCVYAEQRIDFFLNVINAHYQATNRITSRKVKLSVMLRQNKEARDLLIVKYFKDQMIKSSSLIFLNGFSGQRSQQWTFTHQGTIVCFDVKYSILESTWKSQRHFAWARGILAISLTSRSLPLKQIPGCNWYCFPVVSTSVTT